LLPALKASGDSAEPDSDVLSAGQLDAEAAYEGLRKSFAGHDPGVDDVDLERMPGGITNRRNVGWLKPK
jgi:hypothetical protein